MFICVSGGEGKELERASDAPQLAAEWMNCGSDGGQAALWGGMTYAKTVRIS